LVRDGDRIVIDAELCIIDVLDAGGKPMSQAELAKRKLSWTPPALKAHNGTLFKYIRAVKNASEGCVTDEA
jgi:dihydroxy-acid dehydratase